MLIAKTAGTRCRVVSRACRIVRKKYVQSEANKRNQSTVVL